MKSFLTSLFFISSVFTCISQNKTLDVYFPDTVNEKEITLHYSIYGISNYFYEPYMNIQKTTGNHLSFEIPDSITTFYMILSPLSLPYKWEKNTILFIKPGEKLSVYLDSAGSIRFEGDNVNLHQFMYALKKGTGWERAERTLNDFKRNGVANSFYDFINQEIALNINVLDSLLINQRINMTDYTFAKNQTVDDYLYRAGMTGRSAEKKYFPEMDSISFYSDLDKLFSQYNESYEYQLSAHDKAALKALGLISGAKLELGLDSIYWYISYLSREEQEKVAASNIISNTAVGQLDLEALASQRQKFKDVFPNSIYNPVLEGLHPLQAKDYIIASYSIENGFQEYGRIKANLSDITGMFIGKKPVLLDFWATWCSPCLKEFEHRKDLEAFLDTNGIGMVFISVDYAGAYDQWKQVIEKKQLVGLHYLGTQKLVEQLPYFNENKYIPRYVLLDEEGVALIENCELPSSGKLIQQIRSALRSKFEN